MLARGSAPLLESGDLAAFLAQLDGMPAQAAAEDQLRCLGLLADDPGDAPWTTLMALDWFCLLRGLASRRPMLAVTLAALSARARCGIGPPDRFGNADGEGRSEGEGWALHAALVPDAQIRLWLPGEPGQRTHWRFPMGDDVRRIDSELLCAAEQQSGGGWLALAQARQAETCGHAGEEIRQWRRNNALALVSGVLWCLLDAAREHAAERPMFGRRLIDFPTVQLRLLRLHVELLVAEELADIAITQRDGGVDAVLLAQADALRIDAQQICGGTGYMAQSPFAAALGWLECAAQMLRDTLQPHEFQHGMTRPLRQRALDRLARSGVTLEGHRHAAGAGVDSRHQ